MKTVRMIHASNFFMAIITAILIALTWWFGTSHP